MAKTFRNDINGLRAYAVLAVMLYHFGVPLMPGGFIGVDIFFVLSGFLMTSIIAGGLAKGNFSVGLFYLGRARRIIPALAVLCAVLLMFGWFWLAPSDYTMLGKHTTGAMSFFSNFTLKDEEGYFDAPSQTKWLLHTWSLSVEWQFYLIYPLLLMLFHRFVARKPHHLLWLLIVLAALSLIACGIVSPRNTGFAFYLLPTRAWEMLLGGIVYLYGQRVRLSMQASIASESAGMAMIAVAAITFTTDLAWPGLYALLPTVGTALVLLAAHQDSPFTAHPWLQRIGHWSYSIYLWHWPVAVGLGYFALRDSPFWVVVGIVTSLGLGYLSFRWVERPARNYFTANRWQHGTRAALGTVILLAGLGAIVDHRDGLPGRVDRAIATIDAEAGNNFKRLPPGCGFDRETQELVPCIIGKEPIRWVVLGDSHAGAIVGAVQKALPGGIQYYSHQCAIIFGSDLVSKGRNNHCDAFLTKMWAQIQALPPEVSIIAINRYSVHTRGPNEGVRKPWGVRYTGLTPEEQKLDADALYRKKLPETLCTMQKNRRVAAVLPIPEMGIDVPKTLARHRMVGRDVDTISLPLSTYAERNALVIATLKDARRQCGITLLDPVPYLCEGGQCYGAKDSQPRYFDDDHLSEYGNRLLVPMFRALKR